MKDKKKRGFTLVEAVLCVAIIGVIALGYLYLTSSSANLFQAGTNYDRKTSELIEAAQEGAYEEGTSEEGAVTIQFYDAEAPSTKVGQPLPIDRITLSDESGEGSVYYYVYQENAN